MEYADIVDGSVHELCAGSILLGIRSREATCELAAEAGDLPALKDMVARGMPVSVNTCRVAAEHGRLRILQWLRQEADCPWDKETLISAAAGDHEAVFCWALDNGCPFPADILFYAMSFETTNALTSAKDAADKAQRGLIARGLYAEAVKRNSVQVLEWLHANARQFDWEEMCGALKAKFKPHLVTWAYNHGAPEQILRQVSYAVPAFAPPPPGAPKA